MKKTKDYSRAKQLYFKPEINLCPHCSQPLKRSHIAWQKSIFTLKETLHTTSYAYKCKNKNCKNTKETYRSTEAELLSLKHYQFGIDTISQNRPPILPRPLNHRRNQTNGSVLIYDIL
ncbi:MAG: hypothetical protein LBI79_08145 [Nitrososphaerota archaeon]|nr:hypothetical protein [Nitrososphaerota archaeon]